MTSRYISALCLVALCATAVGPLQAGLDPPEEYIWSQAFYYGIWAAILYFVVSALMTVTFWGASSGHFSKNFDLTASQRTLMLQTILFLTYLLLGAKVFSVIEDWSYLDAVYWADVTLFTVGFGDFATKTTLGRALLFPYALIGVVSLGLVISSIRSMILDRARRHVDVRMREKTRRKLVRTITQKGDDCVLEPVAIVPTTQRTDSEISNHSATEYKRRKAEFELMRQIQSKALSRRRWTAMATSTGTWFVFWLVGAVIFWKVEKQYQPTWDYFDSFYLCFVTLTTIGYGDRTPISSAGRSFFVFWSLLALPTMTVLISNAEDTVVKFIRDTTLRIGDIVTLPRVKLCPESGTPETAPQPEPEATTTAHISHAGPSSHRNRQRHPIKHISPHNPTHHKGPHAKHAVTAAAGGTRDSIDHHHRHRLLQPLPRGRQFHLLLVSEMQSVSKHIQEKRTRHYTFEEWAWYLRLLGEDESNPDTHRRAKVHDKKSHHEQFPDGIHTTPDHGDHKWSWVGYRSPLTAGKEESEWVMERLMAKLEDSLTQGTED